jgi:hypothetical protein
MPRKILIVDGDGKRPVLSEVPAANELELQTLLRDTPDLIPTDELGIAGPLLVVGRETYLASGAVDLVAIARGGELLIVELKTGPQNPDFRTALAQAVDYGADLWGMSLDVFESTVAIRYFKGPHCQEPLVKGKASLAEAARAVWDGISDDELAQLQERLRELLSSGSFLFIVAAQRFTPPMIKTIDYLNARTTGARFAALELVAFAAYGLQAFESRTAAGPRPNRSSGGTTPVDENSFLSRVDDQNYRQALRELLESCRGLQLRLDWGTVGVSIRVPTSDLGEPLTIAWLFPPGQAGWSGLRDLTLGFDPWSADQRKSITNALEAYQEVIARLPGGTSITAKNVRGRRFTPAAIVESLATIKDALASLVKQVNEGAPSPNTSVVSPER